MRRACVGWLMAVGSEEVFRPLVTCHLPPLTPPSHCPDVWLDALSVPTPCTTTGLWLQERSASQQRHSGAEGLTSLYETSRRVREGNVDRLGSCRHKSTSTR
jgi:hypothetical protein